MIFYVRVDWWLHWFRSDPTWYLIIMLAFLVFPWSEHVELDLSQLWNNDSNVNYFYMQVSDQSNIFWCPISNLMDVTRIVSSGNGTFFEDESWIWETTMRSSQQTLHWWRQFSQIMSQIRRHTNLFYDVLSLVVIISHVNRIWSQTLRTSAWRKLVIGSNAQYIKHE